MSINKMDWSRRNSNGAVAHSNNQQYLPQSTSSTVPTMPNHMAYVPPSSYNAAQTFVTNSGNKHFLKSLLGAKSAEEILKIQRSILSKAPVQQNTQVSPGQYNSYSPLHKTTTATNHQSSQNVQNPVVSNYQTQVYPNPALQTFQQAQPVPAVQQQAQPAPCYSANGYNTREVQQSMQNTQSSGYSHKRAYQQMPNSYAAKRHSRNVQKGYQPTLQQPKSQTIYSVPNQSAGPYVVPVSTANYQNGQNIQNQIGSNTQTNTVHSQRDVNDYVQSSQRQIMTSLHSGFVNNSPTVLPSATVGQLATLYPQSNTNTSNVYNVSVNQRLSNPNQNFVVQNVQQPVQSYTVPQDQHSVPGPPPAYSGSIPPEQRQEILALLKVYQNVKQKYLTLNHENNLLRQKMQSSQHDNSGGCAVRPPLISSLPNRTVPTNDTMGSQETSQNASVQSQSPSNTTYAVQTPTLYDSLNVPVQNTIQSSNSFSSHVYTANNEVLNQRNYTGFDSGQRNLVSSANSPSQAVGSETLRDQIRRDTSMVSIQANSQYLSNGNSNKGDLSQDGLFITSVKSLVQTTSVSPETSNTVNTMNTSNVYANKPLTSSSREAIKASLHLWKSVPQSSTQNNSGYSEPKHMVDNSLDTLHLLEDIAPSSINEPTAVTLTQKSEHTGSNPSKGSELQVAIVSPLVQIKELVGEINQIPKVVPQGKDLAINGVNGFNENDCFNKLQVALESVDAAAAMNSLEVVRSLPCSVEVSSNCNVDQNSTQNSETADKLQISGICTLVEGNSYYDSSIAMMFEGSLQTEHGSPLARTNQKADGTLQCSQEDVNICSTSQSTSSLPPTTEMVASKTEAEGEIDTSVNIHDDQQGADVYCLEIQPEQNQSGVFDSESNSVSDQLSELLTEFPFGIKNYMSENKLESTDGSLGKLSVKPETLKRPAPCSLDGSFEGSQSVYAMDTSIEKIKSPNTEVTDQQSIIERVPTPKLLTDEVTSVQLEDDGFEICDSPDENIHITLLEPDQITKIFPEECAKPIVPSEESLVESFSRESGSPVEDVAVSPIKEKSDNETASGPDRELFCCLFSWLTHTNGNAPKCSCKLTDLGETEELTNSLSEHTAVIKTKPLADALEPSKDCLKPLTDGLEPSFSDPCRTDLEKIKNDEMLLPVIKRPKLEPIEMSLENKHSPQEEIKTKLDLSEKYLEDQSENGLRNNDTLTKEKILQPKSHLGDPDRANHKDSLSDFKSKVDGPRKLEKLIVKTDFLKSKHSLKMKRKYKETKSSHAEEGGARDVQKNSKNGVGESAKSLNMDRIIDGKANNEKCKPPASTVQQSERSMNKQVSPSSSDKSHSRSRASSLVKHKERVKSRRESHYEKVKKVPTVQEYLERKRELYNKRLGPKVDQRDEPAEVRHRVVEKPSKQSSANNSVLAKMLKSLSPAKMNVKTKNTECDVVNQTEKRRPKSSGTYESVRTKHRGQPGSHGKGSLANKGLDQKGTSSKNKIYLSPCDGSRRASYEGISLTKLQIRCSPEKPRHSERRKSLDSVHSKRSKSETKNKEAPKMLEFKLCPEFVHKSPSTQEKKGEPKAAKEKKVEGIKSKKEAWCSSVPSRKSWMDNGSEDQGHQSPTLSTPSFNSTQKNSSKPVQDSQTTFNVFRQMYHEKRSKSLDSSL